MNKNSSLIIGICSLLAIALIGVLCYMFWPSAKSVIDGSKYYTQEQVQDSYNKGYNDGINDKDELTEQVGYYKEQNDQYLLQIGILNNQVSDLQNQNSVMSQTVTNLTTIKNENEATIQTLNSQILANNSSISSLNTQISDLQNQVTNLTAQGAQSQSTIDSLNTQIANLTALKNQLMATNTSNANTITVLNNQVTTLNARISELSLQISNNSGNVNALNNRISQLEDTIAYYENYIQTLQQNTQAVVTFEVDGSVYNIQIVNIGDYVTVITPANTNNMIFNGWKVNNTLIDLSTYQITQNTRIVADITYKYDVNFVVDNTTYDTQYVILNNSPTIPTAPTKSGYDFDGWSFDGVNVVNVTQQTITQNTTYYAVFTKVHTVTFMNGQNVVQTQSVRNGNYATNVVLNDVGFQGWLLNDISIDILSYVITADTVFVADIYVFEPVNLSIDRIRSIKGLNSNASSLVFDYYTGRNNVYEVNNVNILDGITPSSVYGVPSEIGVYFVNNTFYVLSYSDICIVGFNSYNSNFAFETIVFNNFHFNSETDQRLMFYGCSATTLDLCNVDFSPLTSYAQMFEGCLSQQILLSNLDTSNVTNMSSMFKSARVTTLDLSSFNTSNVTDMSSMFSTAVYLTGVNLSSFDTSNVINMSYMFSNCSRLNSLNLSNFNTSSVTNMCGMFDGCSNLTSLTLSNFNTSNVTTMESMFRNCSKLTSLDLSSFNFSNLNHMGSMFHSCSRLVTIYVSNNFDLTFINNAINSNPSSISYSNYTKVFYGCSNLIGGNGTHYNSSNVNVLYACIDTSLTPGYFTVRV